MLIEWNLIIYFFVRNFEIIVAFFWSAKTSRTKNPQISSQIVINIEP